MALHNSSRKEPKYTDLFLPHDLTPPPPPEAKKAGVIQHAGNQNPARAKELNFRRA